MDEMYEIPQQAKYRVLGIDEVYKISDGWNVRNWLIYCKVWIWILQNFLCLICINLLSVVKLTLMSLFRLFGLCLFVWLFGIYQNSYAIIHRIGLFTLVVVAVWNRIFLILRSLLCAWYTWNFLCHQS